MASVITVSPLVIDQKDDLKLDLDLWEVINPSDGEYSDDSFSVDCISDDDVISLDDASSVSFSVVSIPNQVLNEVNGDDLDANLDLDGHIDGGGVFGDEVDDNNLVCAQRRIVFLGGGSSRYSAGIRYGDIVNRDGCYDDDTDEEYDDDSYDLDDELVPWNVSSKLGRQRMRKLGKRGIAKTSPYSHLKPGCVRGKHGLGMKFRC